MTSRHSIITTGGMDGACCAAMVLMKFGQSPVRVTSQNAIHHALRYQLHEDPRPEVVHVCGVGIADNAHEVYEHLDALRAEGIQAIWYCGRGYLDQYSNDLEKHCTVVFTDSESNTAAIAAHLGITGGDRVPLLLDLAREYVRETAGPEEHRFWHYLVSSSSQRYFQLGDEDAFLRVLLKLAGLLAINKADKEAVALYERAGRSKKVSLGRSPAMHRLRKRIKLAATPDEPVLITGPSGSGKELVARALHDGSPRRAERFYPVNCAILGTSPDLAYDRLFGHVAGAYTHAKGAAPGAFEAAGGGTLFLDEVAELPLPVQTQLLRVIEEKTISPLGTVEARPVDVRVLAATNRDLPLLVRNGKFRLDLYHRLSVLTIAVPPLKDRIEDAVTIADEVAREMTVQGHQLKLGKKEREAILGYDWPGNIRQLTNLVKRAAYLQEPLSEIIEAERRRGAVEYELLAGTSEADSEFVGLFSPRTSDDVRPMREIRDRFARRALELFDGNWTRASKALGVSTNTLRSWIAKY